ncbi:MAG TPA: thiol reductant ABC exporter subunit CydC [Virgibacillus sp.]|nr:thiol reductant ABC exporter subunit CydC [Virgibacillus sp.]
MREWVLPYLKQYKSRMSLSLVLGILGIGSGAMLLFVSGYLISKSSLRPENIMVVYVPVVAVRAFSIGQAVFLYAEKLVSHDLVLRTLENMRRKLYQIVEPQALFLRSRYQTGDLLGVLSDDIEHLQDLYLRSIIPAVMGLTIYTIMIAVFGIFDITFAIMMALMLGVLVFLVPVISFYMTRSHHTTMKRQRNKLYQHLTDAIFGMSDWQASGRTNELLNQVHMQDEKMIETERNIQRWQHLRNAFMHLVIGIIIITVMGWSSVQANEAVITPTLIAAFTLMTFSITDALIPISEATEHIPTYIDSIQRIQQVESKEIAHTETKEVDWLAEPQVELQVSKLRYQYDQSDIDVIKDLSLTIPAGKKIAILGRSGTGKSTLLKLLAGAIDPTEGMIMLNGEKMHSGLLSQAVSVLNQKPHLFSTTIANNIRISRPEATDEEVMTVINQAQLAPLIASLPNGVHTPMREMGHRFSGGERQRIAFARVLLQDTPIILIDEATIGLDPVTEHHLLQTMLAATTGKTVIWVTHHLAGVESMDEVIFLKEGEISMQGSHDELMKTEEHYRELYAMDQGI